MVLVMGGVYFTVASGQRQLDDRLCPTTPDSITVLLVDVTDPMNMAQRQDFENQLTRLKNSIPRYGKLVVAKVDATGDRLLSPVITRCNPGTAEDVSSATGNPGAVQKQWDEQFDAPLKQAFAQLQRASGADRSPILESIQSVALTELQRPGLEKMPKRLVVASDLLQNTADVSFYRDLPAPRSFVESPLFRRMRTDLRGVAVELWMLERPDAAQTQPRSLAELWERIIDAEGGEVRRIYNVSG
ncbi:MAG: hypothetical protein KYX69_11490 [Sphingomonas sp.]|uniref:hypothetical protein n=1 Tax=Sphingomonas sp. TaxID=28214 RepID=UPI0026202218|nr:hypothetical protein [Sphingomonas sp.]MDK2768328.1 hypothetical protein [Sphingomonas sp.]